MFAKCPAGQPGTADEVANMAELLMSDSKTYSPAVFQQRNRWLVDHSERVIAVFTRDRGGTKNTLDYARRKGGECIIIDGK